MNANKIILPLLALILLCSEGKSQNTSEQGVNITVNELNIMLRDLRDYQHLLALRDIEKIEIQSLQKRLSEADSALKVLRIEVMANTAKMVEIASELATKTEQVIHLKGKLFWRTVGFIVLEAIQIGFIIFIISLS